MQQDIIEPRNDEERQKFDVYYYDMCIKLVVASLCALLASMLLTLGIGIILVVEDMSNPGDDFNMLELSFLWKAFCHGILMDFVIMSTVVTIYKINQKWAGIMSFLTLVLWYHVFKTYSSVIPKDFPHTVIGLVLIFTFIYTLVAKSKGGMESFNNAIKEAFSDELKKQDQENANPKRD